LVRNRRRFAAAGYPQVGYFDGPKRREHYDDFYGKVLQVVDVNVLSFADHVQALLVVFIRYVLEQPRAAEWFRECWTGPRGAGPSRMPAMRGAITTWGWRSTGEI
jgi:hypothetical protein